MKNSKMFNTVLVTTNSRIECKSTWTVDCTERGTVIKMNENKVVNIIWP